jgi:hypothetical protein
MSTSIAEAGAPSPDELSRVRAALRGEIYDVRAQRWWTINSYKLPLLKELSSDKPGSNAEERIRNLLLDLVDPLGPDAETRVPLEERDIRDRGLLGLWLLAQPRSFTYLGEEFKPYMTLTDGRDEDLERLRGDGKKLMRGRSGNRTPGPGWVCLEELTDDLLALAIPSICSGAPIWKQFELADETLESGKKKSDHAGLARSLHLGKSARVAIGVTFALVLTAALVGSGINLWPIREDPAGQFAPKSPPLVEGTGLAVGLQAINRSFNPSWGTSLIADPTDRLTFDLWIINRSHTTVQPVTAWLQHKPSPARLEQRRVRVELDDQHGKPILHSRWISVLGTSDKFGGLGAATKRTAHSTGPDLSAKVFDTSNRLVRSMELYGRSLQGVSLNKSAQIGPWLRLPKLAPSEEIHVMFDAEWHPYQYPAQGRSWTLSDPRLTLSRGGTLQKGNKLTARIGEVVSFEQSVGTQANVPISTDVRIRVRPEQHGQIAHLSAYATAFGHTVKLGDAFVSSRSRRAIDLVAIDNSSEVFKLPDRCKDFGRSKWQASPMPDGIDQAGVSIGTIGGFLPRDPCDGLQLRTRIVRTNFDVVARND